MVELDHYTVKQIIDSYVDRVLDDYRDAAIGGNRTTARQLVLNALASNAVADYCMMYIRIMMEED